MKTKKAQMKMPLVTTSCNLLGSRVITGVYGKTCQQIKDSIMFEYHDCQHTNALPMIDLIFARDLLSLLDENAQKSVISDFEEKLKGNGTLFLGENESISHVKEFMEHSEGALTAYSKQ